MEYIHSIRCQREISNALVVLEKKVLQSSFPTYGAIIDTREEAEDLWKMRAAMDLLRSGSEEFVILEPEEGYESVRDVKDVAILEEDPCGVVHWLAGDPISEFEREYLRI